MAAAPFTPEQEARIRALIDDQLVARAPAIARAVSRAQLGRQAAREQLARADGFAADVLRREVRASLILEVPAAGATP